MMCLEVHYQADVLVFRSLSPTIAAEDLIWHQKYNYQEKKTGRVSVLLLAPAVRNALNIAAV